MSQLPVPGISLTATRTVEEKDTAAVYGSGLHERFIIDNGRFMEKLKGQ
ncbi:MAG: hypothetical protein GX622_12180 [Bacteroidales bacterium]|nr:hypothetical protein [Bacteroidales bacterium]